MEFTIFKNSISSLYSPAEVRILWQAYRDAESIITPESYITELLTGKPYQQILGWADFFGERFKVNEHVLIPRPETEELLELAMGHITKKIGVGRAFRILEVGTGSGVISVVLKKHFPQASITAVDIDSEALKVATGNAELHGQKIKFLKQDYLNWNPQEKFEVLISNPPYIGQDEASFIEKNVSSFEPHHALFSPVQDPLIFYRKMARDCHSILNSGGLVFLEINQRLGRETLELFSTDFFATLEKDLSGNDRFISAELK